MKISNYEITKKKMETRFLEYDQEHMIRKYNLKYEESYLYIVFVGRWYRVNRGTGGVEWSDDNFRNINPATFNEAMTIYDILCYAKDGCRLSGRFCPVNSLKGVVHSSGLGEDMTFPMAGFFDKAPELLELACQELGGEKQTAGEMTYQIPLFEFLPVVLQFWASDEDFPASLKLMWDENILSYMHYETTYYAANHLLDRLKEIILKQEII